MLKYHNLRKIIVLIHLNLLIILGQMENKIIFQDKANKVHQKDNLGNQDNSKVHHKGNLANQDNSKVHHKGNLS